MAETKLEIRQICPTAAQGWIRQGAIVVDVRDARSHNQVSFDVPNLLHIPLDELPDRYRELPRDQKLILACEDGTRSLQATAFLVQRDFDDRQVVHMKHGLVRWVQKGYPVHGDAQAFAHLPSAGCCSGGHHHTDSKEHTHGERGHSCCGGHH